jgi:hypothetical protein
VHAALLRLGHKVEIHPQCPHPTRRPDFLVLGQAGNGRAFVEVTSFGLHSKLINCKNRESRLFDAINSAALPSGRLIGYRVRRRGSDSPSASRFKRAVEDWALRIHDSDDHSVKHQIFTTGDWVFDITLHNFSPDKHFNRAVGIRSRGVHSVSPNLDLREAI